VIIQGGHLEDAKAAAGHEPDEAVSRGVGDAVRKRCHSSRERKSSGCMLRGSISLYITT